MMSRRFAVFAALAAVACNIDSLLEGPQPPTPVRLELALQATNLTVAPNDSATLSVSATRVDSTHGNVAFSVSLPLHFDATVTPGATIGAVTAATITIRAGADVSPGTYFATVRVAGEPAGGATVPLVLTVAPHPSIGLTPLRPTVAVVPGGVAPLTVLITRVAVAEPVTIALVGPPGVTLGGANEPVSTSNAMLTVAVAPGFAPGTYPVILRASAPGVPDSDAPVSITVLTDTLQLLVDDVATTQAAVVTRDVIVNRNGANGSVTFSAEGLPTDVTLSAAPTGGTTASMALAVGAHATPGAYTVTLHGDGGGVRATTTFVLSIATSNVMMTIVPENVAVLQGSAAASVLTLVRTAFTGAVSIELSGVPDGMSVQASDATVTGTTTDIVVTASKGLVPGAYQVTVRAIPLASAAGAPALDPVTASLTVSVLEAPLTEGNVVLDWSKCSVPDWVAVEDGTGPWTQIAGVQGRFRFAVSAVRGGIAYSTGARSLTVKFAASSELTAAAVDMCDTVEPAVQLGTVTETVQYMTPFANGFPIVWDFGGGTGNSSVDAPNVTILGVRPGTHDLVGVSQTRAGSLIIVRDITPATNGFIGTIPVPGQFSLDAILGRVRVGAMTGERVSVSESYLTTAACTPNDIFQTGISSPVTTSATFTMLGVPSQFQRATDFHHVEVTAMSSAGSRFASLSVHAVDVDVTPSVTLPPNLPAYSVIALPGAHLRLRLSMNGAPIGYTGALRWQFSDGLASVTISSSQAALAGLGSGNLLLDMPDLSTSGMPAGTVPQTGTHGTWTLSIDGSNGRAGDCVDGASRWSNVRRGTF